MRKHLIEKGYIPLDKSWMIRIGVLDLFGGYKDSREYLKQHYDELSEDLKSLYQISAQWRLGKPINVGESGTLYRFLRFALWKLGQEREFIRNGTLRQRKICDNPEIINWSLEQLLTLDNRTSQWASASVLMGNPEKIAKPPYKLQVTYDAVQHWNNARKNKKRWEPRYDETILTQASAYIKWVREGRMDFVPQQSEDYCFARTFNILTAKSGEARWPSLRGHESDRIAEMEKELYEKKITSRDHRVVQAIAMLRNCRDNIMNPDCVNKSWPQFWKFLEDSPNL